MFVPEPGNFVQNCCWLCLIWKKRSIYTPMIIHIYDTATDIGVIYIWGTLALSNEDIAFINIMSFFILGIIFIILYRIFMIFVSIFNEEDYFRAFLCIFDFNSSIPIFGFDFALVGIIGIFG